MTTLTTSTSASSLVNMSLVLLLQSLTSTSAASLRSSAQPRALQGYGTMGGSDYRTDGTLPPNFDPEPRSDDELTTGAIIVICIAVALVVFVCLGLIGYFGLCRSKSQNDHDDAHDAGISSIQDRDNKKDEQETHQGGDTDKDEEDGHDEEQEQHQEPGNASGSTSNRQSNASTWLTPGK